VTGNHGGGSRVWWFQSWNASVVSLSWHVVRLRTQFRNRIMRRS